MRFKRSQSFDTTTEEIHRTSQILAGTEWLLLLMVILYAVVMGSYDLASNIIFITFLCIYAIFVILFHYTHFFSRPSQWRISFEIWLMIGFVTTVLWFTGGADSPLLNLYLLPIVNSALTLDKSITFWQVCLIIACYLLLGFTDYRHMVFSHNFVGLLVKNMVPYIIVAYLTSMLASNFRLIKKQIELLSETDSLSGLLNMRGFYKIVDRQIKSSIRYQHPFALLLLDSDNLKTVNDQHGHDAGDALIVHVAKIIQKNVRDIDIAARYGGDEFVVLLMEVDPARAKFVAERIRKNIEEVPLRHHDLIFDSTMSIGIATFPNDGASIEEILSKADKAMYHSKQSGRNCVTLFEEGKHRGQEID